MIIIVQAGLPRRAHTKALISFELTPILNVSVSLEKKRFSKVAFHLSVLVGRKELVLASLNGKVQGARARVPATTLQIPAFWPTGAGELSGSDP